ncbi:unnamed protein product [Larinioides sclopetarius]|uniref:Uncharacterized protein n=1 Tax=Larinioides sclopetarius TaxID=280406 RepID=A0AAV2BIJ0_9ARAC
MKMSFSEKQPPPKRLEETLEDCHELCKSHCGHGTDIEGCCCRCCTCRGCPSCRTEYCHPCNFSYGREKAATHCSAVNKFHLNSNEQDQPCEKHPCGCYFVPNVNE